jgi:hypothetical protein
MAAVLVCVFSLDCALMPRHSLLLSLMIPYMLFPFFFESINVHVVIELLMWHMKNRHSPFYPSHTPRFPLYAPFLILFIRARP